MVGTQRIRKAKKLSQEEIDSIEFNYGFHILENKPMFGGMRSSTVCLNTNQGNRVVKIYPNNFDYALINFQATVSNHLYEDNIKSPRVFFNSQKKLVTPINDTNYIIMDYLKGRPPKENEPNIVNLTFRPLARALKSLEKFDYSEIKVAPELKIPLSEQLTELSENIAKKGKNQIDPFVWNYIDRLNTLYGNLSKKLNGLETQLILGDYNLGSILIHDGEYNGMVDFDFIHLQGKGYDFMHLFDILFIDKSTKEIPFDKRINFNKLREVMGVYLEEDSSISSNFSSFPMMLQLFGIRNLVDVWGNYYSGRSDREYFEEKKEYYVPRLEIGVLLEDRIIENLEEISSEQGKSINKSK